MATRKRNVEIEIIADDRKAKAGLKSVGDQATTTGKKFSDSAKLISGAMVAGAAVAVGSFVKSSIDSFSNLNESLNAVDVTFGDSAEAVKKLGEESATNVGLSNAEFNSLAVQMSAFAQTIAGDAGDVAGTVDTLTTRVSDFASVMNLDVAEAATLFQSGLAGETEPLRKFGIDLSAAAVNAHGLTMGLGDASGKLSEQEKILARYDSLMKQTDKTSGDFANTSDELANSQRILAAEAENAMAKLGAIVAPDYAQAVSVTSDLVFWLSKLTESAGNAEQESGLLMHLWGEWTLGIGPEIVEWFENITDAERAASEETEGLTSRTAELSSQMDAARHSAGRHKDATEDLTGAQANLTEKVGASTDTLRDYFDLLRGQIDAVFGLEDATDNAAEAQVAVNDAIKKYGDGSPEHLEALQGQSDALLDVRDAEVKVHESGGITREEWKKQQIQLGLTEEAAELLAEDLDRLNAFKSKTINYTITVNGKEYGSIAAMERAMGGGGGGGSATPREQRASGGSVSAGGTYLVGEKGPELLSMGTQAGHVTPNNALGMGAATVYLTVNALDPKTAGRVVVEALQDWQRSNGAIPISTRG